MALRLEASLSGPESMANGSSPDSSSFGDANLVNVVQEKAKELSLDLKSITQLYNEYAVPYELWEVCNSLSFPCMMKGCPYCAQLLTLYCQLIL